MLLSQAPPAVLPLLVILLTSTHRAIATPYHRDRSENIEDSAILVDRDCPVPCGWQGQLCCAANQRCYTDAAGQAQCGAITANAQDVTSAQGTWQYYTSTFVETDLVTHISIYSTFVVAPAPTLTSAGGPTCNYALLETPCGNICCAAGQVCQVPGQVPGQCVSSGGGSSQFYSSYYYSAPLRPTSGGATTSTSSLPVTATVPFQTPVGTAGGIVYPPLPSSSGGLSGGAIAGIVIGVLAAVIILLLLCLYCCLRASFDSLMSLLGLKPKRRTSETIIEEHHHSGGGGLFGTSGAADRPSGTSGWGGMAAALAALAVLLGLRRRSGSYSGKSSYDSYTTSSYDTSESSVSSSGRRTRDSRNHRSHR